MRALFLARDDQSEQINLLSCGPIMLTKSGWKPTGAWHDKGPKQESIGLMMQTNTPEEIVALTNSIEKALREQYIWHTRPTEAIGWWLYWQAEGDAGLKRAVIVNRPAYASADGKGVRIDTRTSRWAFSIYRTASNEICVEIVAIGLGRCRISAVRKCVAHRRNDHVIVCG
jgi:hypothetical protein